MKWLKSNKFSMTFLVSVFTLMVCGLLMMSSDSWGDKNDPPSVPPGQEPDYAHRDDGDWDWSEPGVLKPHPQVTVPTELKKVTVPAVPDVLNLNVLGNLIFDWDYDSGWVSISEDETITLTHSLGGDRNKYMVYMWGRSSGGGRHQGNYGMAHYLSVPDRWIGANWHDLDATSIKVTRGNYDNQGTSKDWDYVRVCILKRQ